MINEAVKTRVNLDELECFSLHALCSSGEKGTQFNSEGDERSIRWYFSRTCRRAIHKIADTLEAPAEVGRVEVEPSAAEKSHRSRAPAPVA